MTSNKYEVVKDYYDRRLWTALAVRNAVVKGWITDDEYEMIVGKPYEEADA